MKKIRICLKTLAEALRLQDDGPRKEAVKELVRVNAMTVRMTTH